MGGRHISHGTCLIRVYELPVRAPARTRCGGWAGEGQRRPAPARWGGHAAPEGVVREAPVVDVVTLGHARSKGQVVEQDACERYVPYREVRGRFAITGKVPKPTGQVPAAGVAPCVPYTGAASATGLTARNDARPLACGFKAAPVRALRPALCRERTSNRSVHVPTSPPASHRCTARGSPQAPA